MSARRRDWTVLGTAAALALAVPALAASYVDSRIDDDLEPALSEALGERVTVGSVEAGLDGSLRLEDVWVEYLLEAEAIEASIGLSSLLAGELQPDEIRVESPQLRVRVDSRGESNLARIAHRISQRRRARAPTTAGPTRQRPGKRKLRRIIVTGGDLVVKLGRRGELRLRDVEARPQRAGVRLLAGGADLMLEGGNTRVEGQFGRGAGDLTLPSMQFRRAIAVGGELTVRHGDAPAATLSEAAIVHRIDDADELHLSALVDRAGAPGRLSVRIPANHRDRLLVEARELPLAGLSALLPRSVELSRTTASGRLALRRTATGLDIAVEAAVNRLASDDRRVADRRVEMDWQLRARGETHGGRIELIELAARSGAIDLTLAGTLARAPGQRFPERGHLQARLARASCGRVLESLPEPMRDRLIGLRTSGTVAASMQLDFSRRDERATQLDVDVDVGSCRIRAEAPAGDPTRIEAPFENLFPDGRRAMVGLGHNDYATLRSLPRYVQKAWVASEDARFYHHNGFDLHQIERSLAVDLRAGAFVRGGSTISQQLVKNVFLDHRRTIARKLQEAVLTWRLEANVGKRVILERYLNIIELGPGIYGLPAAARYWFDKAAADLTPHETAFLVALTPAPQTISRRVRANGGIDPETDARIRMILRHLEKYDVISQRQYDRARRSQLTLTGSYQLSAVSAGARQL